MSLLMDALKRAEASRQASGNGAGPDLSLEPLSAQTPAVGNALPELADHLDAVDAGLAAAAEPAQRPPPPSPPVSPAGANEREIAARSLFAAKPSARPSRLWWLLVPVIAGGAIALYFWLQLQQLNRNGRPAPSARPPAAVTTPPAPALAPATPSRNLLPPLPAAPPQTTLPDIPQTRKPAPNTRVAGELQEGETPIRFHRSPPETDPALLRAWQYLQAGKLDGAQEEYGRSLNRDPKNVDALLGLAAIAQRRGQTGEAARLQAEAFEADPKNAAAQAALILQQSGRDPQASESRLKTLIAAQPESAPLHFALGSLYARQQRWGDAQSAFFAASAADAGNPDYLFNLAVALDHLRQPRPALQHYRQALKAAEQRSAAFNTGALQRRIAELQEQTAP